MSFRLFAKEHAAYLIFQLTMVLFIMSIYWLEGFRNVNTAIYSIVISMLLILSFLFARYVKRFAFYQKILTNPKEMEAALQQDAKSPEQQQVEDYLKALYRLHQNEAQALYANQRRHLQFMNQWVHQMKTPLAVSELLLQEEGEVDKKSMQEEIDRLKRGLDSVLMNARLDTFEQDMQIEQVRLKTLVSEVVSENKRLFITHQVYPVISINEQIIVPTDAKWMKFVIGQFITNAVKYTFDHGKKLHIHTICQQEKGNVLLSFQDEGIGIPTADIPRLTKAFFTGENGRKTGESTGMGLYLANEICVKLGHELSIISELGKGTTVSVLFHNQDEEGGVPEDEIIEIGRSDESVRGESNSSRDKSIEF
ncbi:HAMP domain-containing sensor histidine kinase [Paenisporosarcina sp. TG20]|uniref:sensor histidine kinase n=1 Tax=Paenisporosarcina sp. TG20 TaxID=1211706 RepID=UPI0002E97A22|nr:sensor histidine kinase [Paenisporosarcina sp. TG20]